MTRNEIAEGLAKLLSEHDSDPNILRPIPSRLDWLGRIVPLLKFNPELYRAAQEAADILAQPGFSSSMYSRMEGRILLLARQGLNEVKQGADFADTGHPLDLKALLHSFILEASYQQFLDGHYRDSVLCAFIGLGDYIRKTSGCTLDGAKLINEVFGGASPLLVFSEIESESGKNEQAGFHKLLLGAIEGIRNPKAHSLTHDLTKIKAAQYLVLASLLARRVEESKRNEKRA